MTQDTNKQAQPPSEAPVDQSEPPAPSRLRRFVRLTVRVLLPLIVIAAGAAGAAALVATKPKPKRRKPPKAVTLVEVQRVTRGTERIVVRAMGTVTPAREITLQPQVAGRLVTVSPNLMPGGRFQAGETVVQIERRDYELALAQRKADVAQAEMNYRVELGRQEIAKREWALHHKDEEANPLDLELALRKPHLLQAEAALTAAKASLAQAELNLARTTVNAPFNAIVVRKQVDLGSEVTPQTPLATLAGTDEYWVRAAIPVDRLERLTTPEHNGDQGSPARVRMATDTESADREGHVARLLSDLETQGRMARVLVVVEDPLALPAESRGRSPLLLGSYVHVSIEGRAIQDAVAIPRVALRGEDQIWLMDDESKLAIRRVEIAWRDQDKVLVRRGLDDGDRLVVSDVAAPVEGLEIRTGEQLAAVGQTSSLPAGRSPAIQGVSRPPSPDSGGVTETGSDQTP